MTKFRILVMKKPSDHPVPSRRRDWVAICQDRLPFALNSGNGTLPPCWAHSKEQAVKDMEFTIEEQLKALGVEDWEFQEV
jgi:hypothetical protein